MLLPRFGALSAHSPPILNAFGPLRGITRQERAFIRPGEAFASRIRHAGRDAGNGPALPGDRMDELIWEAVDGPDSPPIEPAQGASTYVMRVGAQDPAALTALATLGLGSAAVIAVDGATGSRVLLRDPAGLVAYFQALFLDGLSVEAPAFLVVAASFVVLGVVLRLTRTHRSCDVF
ncbi:MAG: hypothetical protein JWP75_3719 [Frondihabitans sp.]|nr:hypothetical protein [Frondihabitans sp.]